MEKAHSKYLAERRWAVSIGSMAQGGMIREKGDGERRKKGLFSPPRRIFTPGFPVRAVSSSITSLLGEN